MDGTLSPATTMTGHCASVAVAVSRAVTFVVKVTAQLCVRYQWVLRLPLQSVVTAIRT